MSGRRPTWVVRLMSPSVTAAMNAIPDDRPSRPSIKLMLLIIPTIQKIVKPAANEPSNRMTPGPNGLATKSIVMPSDDRETAPGRSGRASCQPRPQIEAVVDGAETGRDGAADEQRRELGRARW